LQQLFDTYFFRLARGSFGEDKQIIHRTSTGYIKDIEAVHQQHNGFVYKIVSEHRPLHTFVVLYGEYRQVERLILRSAPDDGRGVVVGSVHIFFQKRYYHRVELEPLRFVYRHHPYAFY